MEDESQQSHSWLTALICSGLVLVVCLGGVFALRGQLMGSTTTALKQEQTAREKLASDVTALRTLVDTLHASGTDTNPDIATKLTTLDEQISKLTSRVDALEKSSKPENTGAPIAAPAVAPVPATPALATAGDSAIRLKLAALSGKTYASELAEWTKANSDAKMEAEALGVFATGGIPNEAELIRGLAQAISARPEVKPAEDESTVGKINLHLRGLVSIKKSATADAYVALRDETLREDLTTLQRHVERLSDADRAPLEDWLKQVKDRSAALSALDKITHTSTKQ